MKKVLVSIILFGSIFGYSWYSKSNTSDSSVIPTATINTKQTTDTSSTATIPTSATTTTVATTSSLYKDGTYKGNAVDAYYGFVQVQAVIQGGKLTDAQILSFPNDHHESVQINNAALPILQQEAISAQSAEIDSVSRATFTSDAFKQSLASALSQAK